MLYLCRPFMVADLNTVLLGYTMDDDALATIFSHLSNGVALIHSKGIMHLDLSHGNCALKSFDPPLGIFLDFDSAEDALTSTSHNKGTAPFLAPEVLGLATRHKDLVPFDCRADIWSLVINYRWTAGLSSGTILEEILHHVMFTAKLASLSFRSFSRSRLWPRTSNRRSC